MKTVHLALVLGFPVAVGMHGAAYGLLRHYDYALAGCTESRLPTGGRERPWPPQRTAVPS